MFRNKTKTINSLIKLLLMLIVRVMLAFVAAGMMGGYYQLGTVEDDNI
ncbi:HTH-type transcriptional regulator with cupin domain [Gottschalkia acidurici 9a]|uniref:HTH-type transcriptional regulator with cupin domain n=1 Tax=Gottschalkia acidurici (strain ATCC 7906 / DSM 604 / BCRC 14475 / CIP 104303 / KCTC 5404 / NCIMB 10678 / 9a) TaxID=1128398 RepID=K0B018_GOTA9|nr:HTH-type transcriptional regulator with cupin domain [Gottschalkia acidurici 9a]